MGHSIQVDHDLKIILVRAPAVVKAEDAFDTTAKVEKVAQENSFNKVLLDLRDVTVLPSMEEVYEIVTNHPRHLWVAVLIEVTEALEKDMDFYDMVARNRGRLTRLFGSKDEAIEWLQQMG